MHLIHLNRSTECCKSLRRKKKMNRKMEINFFSVLNLDYKFYPSNNNISPCDHFQQWILERVLIITLANWIITHLTDDILHPPGDGRIAQIRGYKLVFRHYINVLSVLHNNKSVLLFVNSRTYLM